MSDRITNAELKQLHSYIDELDNEEFVILLRKLLATFNFLVINGREWKEKSKKVSLLELKIIEKEQETITLNNRLQKKKEEIEQLHKEILATDELADRYYVGYKSCLEKQERLEKRIKYLENEINNRSNTKNQEE